VLRFAFAGLFGVVVDCVIMCDPHTRKPRGFGFVTYDSCAAVERACVNKFHELNGTPAEARGRACAASAAPSIALAPPAPPALLVGARAARTLACRVCSRMLRLLALRRQARRG
jgi:hypothetical protein